MCRQQLDYGLVVRVERGRVWDLVCALVAGLGDLPTRSLLRQVESADHFLAGHDRDAEEGAHVRVLGRPPAAEARVGVNIVGAEGLGTLEHRAKHPVRSWQRAHRGDQSIAHSGDDEAAKAALTIRDAKRGIAGVDQLAGRMNQLL